MTLYMSDLTFAFLPRTFLSVAAQAELPCEWRFICQLSWYWKTKKTKEKAIGRNPLGQPHGHAWRRAVDDVDLFATINLPFGFCSQCPAILWKSLNLCFHALERATWKMVCAWVHTTRNNNSVKPSEAICSNSGRHPTAVSLPIMTCTDYVFVKLILTGVTDVTF